MLTFETNIDTATRSTDGPFQQQYVLDYWWLSSQDAGKVEGLGWDLHTKNRACHPGDWHPVQGDNPTNALNDGIEVSETALKEAELPLKTSR